MEISTEKSKVMPFKGRNPIRSKICLKNKILEEVNNCKYLGCNLSCQGEIT
jgi:hypothetical protein